MRSWSLLSDNHTKAARSYNMSRIGSKNTKPEEMVRKYLFNKGLRYRKNDKRYPGKPDLVFPKYRTIVFVNGCFWHMHEGCKEFVYPKSNKEYWYPKLQKNKLNDGKYRILLESDGWKVITVWECQLMKDVREKSLDCLYNEITHS